MELDVEVVEIARVAFLAFAEGLVVGPLGAGGPRVDGGLLELDEAVEQWLRRIPDDPGALLRRKFLYQYQQRAARAQASAEPW